MANTRFLGQFSSRQSASFWLSIAAIVLLGLACSLFFVASPGSGTGSMGTAGSEKAENPLALTKVAGLSQGAVPLPGEGSGSLSMSTPDTATTNRILASYSQLPLAFEANQGQADPQVKFLSRGPGYQLFLTRQEAVLTFEHSAGDGSASKDERIANPAPAVLRLKLLGGNRAAKVTGIDEQVGKSSYFIGNDPARWQTNVSQYAKVRYHEAYPGVDLVFYGKQQQLEYDFVVAPGKNPNAIRMEITQDPDGSLSSGTTARPLTVASNGDLVVSTAAGDVRFQKPVVYQRDIDAKHVVDGHWVLKGKTQVGFEVASYDAKKPLIIDPALSFSTYLGGSAWSTVYGPVLDSAGNIYVTGDTLATDFPTTSGAFQTKNGGGHDSFAAKLDPTGSTLIYSTYLGGKKTDHGGVIGVDSSGNAYVAGSTDSSDFPVTAGAFQTTCGGGCTQPNGFIAKVNPTGTALVYSTYLGGSSENEIKGIFVDSSDNVYVGGFTCSADFPITAGAYQTVNTAGCSGTGAEGFVTKLNSTGSGLIYSTFLGGTGLNAIYLLKVDASGNAYLPGNTNSTDFPTTAGAFQTTNAGGYDGFIAKLNPTGTGLVYSTYLGGSADDLAFSLRVDTSGNVYTTGYTCSSNFPTSSGAFQTTYGSSGSCSISSNVGGDGFVTKLNSTGTGLVYSTYLGGSKYNEGFDIAINSAGYAYVIGATTSTNFPTTPGAFQTTLGSGSAVFVTVMNGNGTHPIYSTYVGNGWSSAFAIAFNPLNQSYVVGGKTYSNAFPITPGAFQTSCSLCKNPGVANGFIFKFIVGDQVWPMALNFGNQLIATSSSPLTAVLSNSSSNVLNITSSIALSGTNSSDFAQTSTCGASLAGGASCNITVTFTPSISGPETATLTIHDSAANSPQKVILQGTGTYAQLTPSSLQFGSQTVKTTSGSQPLTLTNQGTAAINNIAISVTGTNPGDFGQTNNCPASLLAGTNCTVNVTFTPLAKGPRSAAVSISDDAGGSPQQAQLSGTGIN